MATQNVDPLLLSGRPAPIAAIPATILPSRGNALMDGKAHSFRALPGQPAVASEAIAEADLARPQILRHARSSSLEMIVRAGVVPTARA